MSSLLKMNKFEVIDLPGMNTLAFLVDRDYEAYSQGYAFLSLEKLRSVEVREDGQIKKVFNVLIEDPEDEDDIVLLTLTDKKAILRIGVLDSSGFQTEDTSISLNYGTIYNSEGIEYRDVAYTPDMKRNFSIIDSQTGEEVKPSLYRDENGNVKGRCKIMPNRPYIVLEVTMDDEAIAKHLLMEEDMNTNASIV